MNPTEELWAAAQRAFDERRPALEDETVLASLEAFPEELAALARLDQRLVHLRELGPGLPPNPAACEQPRRSWRGPLVAAAAAIVLALLAGWWTRAVPVPSASTPSGDQVHPIVHGAHFRVETVRHSPRQLRSFTAMNTRPPSVSTRTQTWNVRRSLLSSATVPPAQ